MFEHRRDAAPNPDEGYKSSVAEDICRLGQVWDHRTVDLHMLLELTKEKGFAVPQDRVFGLLGVLHDRHAWAITPDYGLSVRQVHALAMVQSITVSGCYDILFSSWVRHPLSVLPDEDLRSCVLDFDSPVERSIESGEFYPVVTSLKRKEHGRWEGARLTTRPFAQHDLDGGDKTSARLGQHKRDAALTRDLAVVDLVGNGPDQHRVAFQAIVLDTVVAFYTLGHDSLSSVVDYLASKRTVDTYQHATGLQGFQSQHLDKRMKAAHSLCTFFVANALYPARGTLEEPVDIRPLYQQARSTVGSRHPDLHPHECAGFLATLDELSRVGLQKVRNPPRLTDNNPPQVISELLECMFEIMTWSGRFFVTAQGRLGIGPEATKPGDQIAVFQGARSPFVIRLLDSGDSALVGDSFVLGLMHGEVRDMCQRGEVRAERIVLL